MMFVKTTALKKIATKKINLIQPLAAVETTQADS